MGAQLDQEGYEDVSEEVHAQEIKKWVKEKFRYFYLLKFHPIEIPDVELDDAIDCKVIYKCDIDSYSILCLIKDHGNLRLKRKLLSINQQTSMTQNTMFNQKTHRNEEAEDLEVLNAIRITYLLKFICGDCP